MEGAPVFVTALLLIFCASSIFTSVVELDRAGVGNGAVLLGQAAGVIVAAVVVFWASVEGSALFSRSNTPTISTRNQVTVLLLKTVILLRLRKLNRRRAVRPGCYTKSVKTFIRGFLGAFVDWTSLIKQGVDAIKSIRTPEYLLISQATHNIRTVLHISLTRTISTQSLPHFTLDVIWAISLYIRNTASIWALVRGIMRTTIGGLIAVTYIFDTEPIKTAVAKMCWTCYWFALLLGSCAGSVFAEFKSSWTSFNVEAV